MGAPQAIQPITDQPITDAQLDRLCIHTVRTLSMDAVQQAKSGHPGTPVTFDDIRCFRQLDSKFGFEPDRVVAAAKELLGRA
jgi:hypothetical protein